MITNNGFIALTFVITVTAALAVIFSPSMYQISILQHRAIRIERKINEYYHTRSQAELDDMLVLEYGL